MNVLGVTVSIVGTLCLSIGWIGKSRLERLDSTFKLIEKQTSFTNKLVQKATSFDAKGLAYSILGGLAILVVLLFLVLGLFFGFGFDTRFLVIVDCSHLAGFCSLHNLFGY
jgi:hypothetical protein